MTFHATAPTSQAMTSRTTTSWAGLRADLRIVGSLIPSGCRVLDLGCGGGELLSRLISRKFCSGTGVEKSHEGLLEAMAAGVPVVQLDLDTQLDEFADDSYDVVVLSRTLQTVLQPTQVLRQMARIAPLMIVSMPNFGLWRNRLRLLGGHMPQSKDLPYSWYDTPNLHHATLVDLEAYLDGLGFVVERKVTLSSTGQHAPLGNLGSNLLAGSAIYLLSHLGRPNV